MAAYTKRVQTVLTSEQYEQLTELSEQAGKPLSLLIREAIEQTYFVEIDLRRRQKALERLLSMDAPVSDWPQMEDEIEKGVIDE